MEYVNACDAARILGVSPQLLQIWRKRGLGPAYIAYPGKKIRKRYVYRMAELLNFIKHFEVLHYRLPRQSSKWFRFQAQASRYSAPYLRANPVPADGDGSATRSDQPRRTRRKSAPSHAAPPTR